MVSGGNVIHIKDQSQYDQLKATPGKLICVDFSAVWCGPCRFIAPKYEELSETYHDKAVFLHVDIDEVPDLTDGQDVTGVPTFMFFKDGKLVHQFSGANAANLENTIKSNV